MSTDGGIIERRRTLQVPPHHGATRILRSGHLAHRTERTCGRRVPASPLFGKSSDPADVLIAERLGSSSGLVMEGILRGELLLAGDAVDHLSWPVT